MKKGFRKDVVKLVDDWLEIAYEDLEIAQLCYHQKYYLNTCFMCQQSIEKAIKGAIENNRVMPKPVHNLELLAKDAKIWEILNKDQKTLLKQLTNFAIATRYPSTRGKIAKSLTKETVGNILRNSKEMLLWLCRHIRKL